MYENDSFFTLTAMGQIGLVMLSGVMAMGVVSLFVFATRTWFRAWFRTVNVLLAVTLLWLFVWLSPQIYYFYYVVLLDGLELKNVVHNLPQPIYILRLLSFSDEATLAQHGQGALGWVMIVVALWRGKPRQE